MMGNAILSVWGDEKGHLKGSLELSELPQLSCKQRTGELFLLFSLSSLCLVMFLSTN